MSTDLMRERTLELEKLAHAAGLKHYPVQFFEVPASTIYEVASYGLPTRYSHWSFGKVYEHQKTYGEMGMSKIYELILNNDPSFAFLDKTNPDTINLLVVAHCYLEGTYVQTIDGAKPIEEIRGGDVVFDASGKLNMVKTPTCSPYEGEIVGIQTAHYKFWQTEDHKLLAIRTNPADRRKYRSWEKAFSVVEYTPEWTEASLLKPGDFLVVPKKKCGNGGLHEIEIPISKTLHKQQIAETKVIPLNQDFGELVGLYLSEGYARSKGQMGLCFHSDETSLHQRSESLVKKILGLDVYHSDVVEQHSHQVCFNEICVAKFFREKFGHHSWEKRLPTDLLEYAPAEFLKGVLIGFFNGDGTKCQPRSLGWTTTSPQLAVQIQTIGMLFDILFGVNARDGSTDKQERRISFVGCASGAHDQQLRSLLGLEQRITSRSWSGIIERENAFYVKIQSIETEEYEGLVYCLDTNSGSFTLLNGIATHNCFAHSDFFANNVMFQKCGETDMVNVAKRHAEIIDNFRRDYGDDEVDEWLDVALALERHVDVYRGRHRDRYDDRHVEFEEHKRGEWDDVVGKKTPLIKKVVKGLYIPPHPEKDLLWFLANYANLEPWQESILDIVRRESYYFYPQYRTKVMNEGWASYWHAELMRQYSFGDDNEFGVKGIKYPLSAEEHLDFVAAHEKVVQPGLKLHLKVEMPDIDPRTGRQTGTVKRWNPVIAQNPHLFHSATRLNPYYVGFRMFRDIKERWDQYFEQGYMENEYGDKVPVTINGSQKIREVMEQEDDVSFFRNYLTEDLVEDLHLFVYGNTDKYRDDLDLQENIAERNRERDPGDDLYEDDNLDSIMIENKTLAVRSKEVKDIVAAFAKAHNNYGAPCIVIRRVDESGLLRLEHLKEDQTNCDFEYASQVLKYVHKAWGREVEMVRKSPERDKTFVLKYNGHNMELDYMKMDYPECVEKNAAPSSW
jgi:stage V sporulation protein R